MDLIRSLTCVSASHLRMVRDDDSHVDRLSHRYTVVICVIFAIIVTTKQYAGDPIDCWVPAQFKASYEKYADSYCWIAGSWYTPMDKELPLSERERRSNRIRYYQWVPFLLLFQAILCYIPRIIWRTLNVRSGLDIINLVDAAIKYESVDKFTDREKIMEYIIRNIERYIGARRSRYERLYGRQLCAMHHHHQAAGGGGGASSSNAATQKQHMMAAVSYAKQRQNRSQLSICCCKCWIRIKIVLSTICFWTGKRLGNYLVVLYMFVKTLWLTNAVSQLFLLNRFIGNDYHAFGLEIIDMLLSGQEWHELRHFPRVTYCDFKIREIGNQHDWTVQCVLRINLFNEVIYIFMWFWLCILAFCSLIDYLTWTLRIIIPRDKLRFVKRHLDIEAFYTSKSARGGNKQRQSNDERGAKSSSKSNRNQANTATTNDQQHQQEPASEQQYLEQQYIDIDKEKKLMREFTFAYLKDDGIFALRIMASSASDLIVTEIISELWKNFKLNYEQPDEMTLVSSPSSASSHTSGAGSSSNSSQASTPASNQQSPTSLIKKQPFGSFNNGQPPKLQQYSPQITPIPIYSNPINNNNTNTNNVQSPQLSNSNSNRQQYPLSSNSGMLPPLGGAIPPNTNTQSEFGIDPSRRSSSGYGGVGGGGGGLGFGGNNNNGNKETSSVIFPQLQQRHNAGGSTHHEIINANPNAKDTHV